MEAPHDEPLMKTTLSGPLSQGNPERWVYFWNWALLTSLSSIQKLPQPSTRCPGPGRVPGNLRVGQVHGATGCTAGHGLDSRQRVHHGLRPRLGRREAGSPRACGHKGGDLLSSCSVELADSTVPILRIVEGALGWYTEKTTSSPRTGICPPCLMALGLARRSR